MPYVNLENMYSFFLAVTILMVSSVNGVLHVEYNGFRSALYSQSRTLSLQQLQAQILHVEQQVQKK